MKKWIFCLIGYKVIPMVCFSQASASGVLLMHELDSIQQSNSIARYFASLYIKTTQNAEDFFQSADKPVKFFIQRLEIRFADYFFLSAQEYNQKRTISGNWNTYYSDSTLSALQYWLLGANAHINGDIWKALTSEFSPEELKEYKHSYFDYQKGLKKIYLDVYAAAVASSPVVRLLHNFTFGSDHCYGKLMLARWRKRQMNLAILYFANKDRFSKKLRRLNYKMGHLNNLILHNL